MTVTYNFSVINTTGFPPLRLLLRVNIMSPTNTKTSEGRP